MTRPGRVEIWVFLILFGSYAYFWQSRDWNSASRLMLTYAMVDRGTITLNGLEDQTHDRAFFQSHFYTDKLPGFSMLATGPYALAKLVFRLPDHPLNVKGFSHWPADYWVTLGTSGLFSALTGALLFGLALELGCTNGRAALVGLAYGLSTPAYAYATMSYGHQASAFCLLASFALLWRTSGPKQSLRVGVAGILAAYASVIELQMGPVSAILGLYLLCQVIGGSRKPTTLGDFAVGAAIPTLLLLGYNQLAFGSPWDMGYFHHTTKEFADVHSEANPLGLRGPQAARALALLWGRHRGLLFYAPVVVLAPLGLISLWFQKQRGMAIVCLLTMASIFAVNLSYPEWTGGWSTGPRLLVPLLPFALLAVAGLLANGGRWVFRICLALAAAGGILMLMFVAIGARVPQDFLDPLFEVVIPIWKGETIPNWPGPPFARTALALLPGTFSSQILGDGGFAFAPLVLAQLAAIGLMSVRLRKRHA